MEYLGLKNYANLSFIIWHLAACDFSVLPFIAAINRFSKCVLIVVYVWESTFVAPASSLMMM